MPKFNLEEKKLIFIQAFIFFGSALASVFVNIFFFANSDLKTTILYNLILFIVLLLFYVLSGWSLRKFSSGFLIKLGILAWAVFYFLMFFLRTDAIHYVFLLAILYGFAAGNYWAGYNLNQYIFTNRNKRIEYFGSSMGVASFLQAIAPFMGGAIISFTNLHKLFGTNAGYGLLFLIVCLIFLLVYFVVGKLPSHDALRFSYKDIIYHKRSKQWKLVLFQQVPLGLFDGSFTMMAGIMYFLILKRELFVGSAQTTGLLLGAIGSIISISLLKKREGYYWIGALGLSVGLVVFALLQNLFGLIFYIIIGGITTPFLTNWLSIVLFHAIDKVEKPWEEKYQFLIERDTVLGIARILSLLFLFFFIQLGDQITFAKHWLYFVPLMPILLGILLWKYAQLDSPETKETSMNDI
jgi:YQGE family putative transporter